MRKLPALTWQRSQKLLLMLLVTTTTTGYFPAQPIPSAVAQQPQKTIAETRRTSRTSVLDAILKLFKQPKNRLGSRGLICPIVPGQLEEVNIIWSDRPLFLWQGKVQYLEIRPYNLESPYSNQPVLWSQAIASTDQSTIYTGKALQAGQKYDWALFSDLSSSDKQRYTFQVMEQDQRDRITSELTALERQLKATGATAEAIALERANFFAERNLWSDALQEIYSVKNPSATLEKTAQAMSAWACKP